MDWVDWCKLSLWAFNIKNERVERSAADVAASAGEQGQRPSVVHWKNAALGWSVVPQPDNQTYPASLETEVDPHVSDEVRAPLALAAGSVNQLSG